ncbi:four helix bundle protein [uncultured Desulfobacter sp.]|uniref:four helix bundle protein n=1 Tax=uncultured Desulfobacter sp. TaxID=240139 RepID=UPI00374A8956
MRRLPSLHYVYFLGLPKSRVTGINRPARDQWIRASQSIPFNIAEGNGKTAKADRRRFFSQLRNNSFPVIL